MHRLSLIGLSAAALLLFAAATAPRAAQLPQEDLDSQGWVSLFNGKDTSGWKLRHEGGKNAWKVENGVLINSESSTDLVTTQKMTDFDLHIEFLVPPGSNSGVYLQGRYEVQVADTYRTPPSRYMTGAIYDRIAPSENASRAAGEWQAFDIRFRQAQRDASGRIVKKAVVTVVHNGIRVIDRKEIEGVTGAALDDAEGTPGALMLQGDHGAIQYRNIRYRPLK
jgi:hypothetical protein